MVYEGTLFVPKQKKNWKSLHRKKIYSEKKYAMSEAGFEPTDTPKLEV